MCGIARARLPRSLAVLAVHVGGAAAARRGARRAGAAGLQPAGAHLRRGGGRAGQSAPQRLRGRQRLHPGDVEAGLLEVSTSLTLIIVFQFF